MYYSWWKLEGEKGGVHVQPCVCGNGAVVLCVHCNLTVSLRKAPLNKGSSQKTCPVCLFEILFGLHRLLAVCIASWLADRYSHCFLIGWEGRTVKSILLSNWMTDTVSSVHLFLVGWRGLSESPYFFLIGWSTNSDGFCRFWLAGTFYSSRLRCSQSLYL